jgi:hypothetical protein
MSLPFIMLNDDLLDNDSDASRPSQQNFPFPQNWMVGIAFCEAS